MKTSISLEKYRKALKGSDAFRLRGRIEQVVGLAVEASGIHPRIGEVCEIYPREGSAPVTAEVVGFRGKKALLMPLGQLTGIASGCPVYATGSSFMVKVGSTLLGRVLSGLGRPLAGEEELPAGGELPVDNPPPNPLQRPPISDILVTGIRTIDSLLTCGQGQRIGIFAGSGVGKSTLLGMIARYSAADVNVIALIGERGREVGDFLRHDLGEEGLRRSVVVVATSDRPALERVRGAQVAATVAEYFRAQGQRVVLMMDSLTRLAMAQREVGLAVGEPPTAKGYTPSVFAMLPRLLERSGTSPEGSITAFYSVLVEGDDFSEPITDAVRSILDGHIVLSRRLATQNHFPAIDVLESNSRLMPYLVDEAHQGAAAEIRRLLAVYQENEDLINIGAYKQGSSALIDRAIALRPRLQTFLQQGINEHSHWSETLAAVRELLAQEV